MKTSISLIAIRFLLRNNLYFLGEHDHVAPLSPQPNSPNPSPERERVKKKCKRKRKDVIIRDFAEMELDAETLSRLNQGAFS